MALNIPAAVSVPGHWGIGPQWWNAAGLPNRAYHGDVDASGQPSDPRWNGSARRSYASGAAVEAEVRATQMMEPRSGGQPDQRVIYLSFFVPNDPDAAVGTKALSDGVLIGFKGASGVGHLIEIDAYDNLNAGAKPAANFIYYRNDASPAGSTHWVPENWGVPGNADRSGVQAAWLDDTRVWVTQQGSAPNVRYTWSINVRIPVTTSGDIGNSGINLSGASFKFFFSVLKDTGPGVVPYSWPRTVTPPSDDLTGKVLPPFASWDDVAFGGGGAGISLNASDVGTTNPVNNQILYPKAAADPPTVNTLYADITNTTGSSIPRHTLRATFRIANWGSQPWQEYLTGTAWQEVLPTFLKLNENAIANNDAGANRRISFPWSITYADAAPWRTGAKTVHQCFLVTLAAFRDDPATPQAVYDFVNDSAFQNMYVIQTASPVQQRAEISLAGVPKTRVGLRGKIPILRNRDVFMFVSTDNMPASLPAGQAMQPRDIRTLLQATTPLARTELARSLPELIRRPDGDGGIFDRPPHVPIDELATQLTTIRYFLYADTGKKIKVGGRLRPLLAQQTSFGYFIQHKGPVVGWDYSLGGNFKTTGQPNMYKLGVPDGKTTPILTKVISYEDTLPAKRVDPVTAGPVGPIQSTIPIIKNLPAVGGLASRITSILRR